MNILILGVTGFVGSNVTRLLLEAGDHVVGAGRDPEAIKKMFPKVQSLECDFLKDVTMNDWLPHLAEIDMVINCVGIFFNGDKNVIWNTHFNAPKALYEAANQCKIQKIIHLSALSINEYKNDYADSKKAIEDFLHTLNTPHVIVRPSLIYGPQSKGSMDVMRKLASSPGLIPLPGKGTQLFQPIYVEDLAKAIKNLVYTASHKTSITLAAVSSQTITLKEMVVSIRQWLRLKKGVFIYIPFFLVQILGWIGDKCSFSTVNTPAITMLKRGNYTTVKEAEIFQDLTGVVPVDFVQGLNLHPALKEDRWYTRLLLIHPFLRFSLAIMWFFSSLTSILPYTQSSSYELLTQVGIATSLQSLILYGAAILNAFIGFGLLLNYKIKLNCILQMLIILSYSLIITLRLPYLWLEPFGPIVKNIPILISVCVLYILES